MYSETEPADTATTTKPHKEINKSLYTTLKKLGVAMVNSIYLGREKDTKITSTTKKPIYTDEQITRILSRLGFRIVNESHAYSPPPTSTTPHSSKRSYYPTLVTSDDEDIDPHLYKP